MGDEHRALCASAHATEQQAPFCVTTSWLLVPQQVAPGEASEGQTLQPPTDLLLFLHHLLILQVSSGNPVHAINNKPGKQELSEMALATKPSTPEGLFQPLYPH